MKISATFFKVAALSTLLSSIILCGDGLTANAANSNTSNGYQLKQLCMLHGEEEVTITADGLKIFNPKNSLTIVYCAPFKMVTYYDVKTGLKCEVPITQNNSPYQRAAAILSGMSLADVPMHEEGKSTILNLRATKFVTDDAYKVEQVKLSLEEKHSRRIKWARYYVFSDLAVPPNQCKFLARHYGLPYTSKIHGVPETFEYTTISSHSSMFLETSSCKRAQISNSEFEIPPKLKRVGSSQEVVTGDNPGVMLF